jgi:hypothetical protein
MAFPVLRHRIVVNFRADATRTNADAIITQLLTHVALPQVVD